MINGFQEQTEPLTEYEETQLLPQIVRGLSLKVGKNNAVTNTAIVRGMKENLNLRTTEPRVRKIINHIRINDLVPCLIATSQGYYIAESEQELKDYEESLLGREEAIRSVLLSIQRQRRHKFQHQQQELFQ